MEAPTDKDSRFSTDSLPDKDFDESESQGFLGSRSLARHSAVSLRSCRMHIIALYISNLTSFAILITLLTSGWRLTDGRSLGVYCMYLQCLCLLYPPPISFPGFLKLTSPQAPANEAVEYIHSQHFRAALFNLTEYMGYPTADGRTDKLWSDLYNCEYLKSLYTKMSPWLSLA